jgi:cytochrome d ubiquinol oxidase subunit I
MLLASTLTTCFLVAGLSAYQLLRKRDFEPAQRMLRLGVIVAAFVIPVQILVGDQHGLNTLEHQPAKIAAMEGLWNTERGAPVVLFAWPDAKEKRNRFAIELPYGASLILTHKLEGEVKGLNEFPDRQPPVAPGVLRIPRDGRDGDADAGGVVDSDVVHDSAQGAIRPGCCARSRQ